MDQIFNASNYIVKATVKPIIQQLYTNPFAHSSASLASSELSSQLALEIDPKMTFWLSVAGLMGASAVALGSYGAHVVYPKNIDDSRKAQFETANKYHFIHSLAMIGVPLLRRPNITGSLFLVGTLLFSGGCYYISLKEDRSVVRIVPIGGTILILGWLSMTLTAYK